MLSHKPDHPEVDRILRATTSDLCLVMSCHVLLQDEWRELWERAGRLSPQSFVTISAKRQK